jgi:hypothetical protein
MPRRARRSADFGPIPLILLAFNGHTRPAKSAGSTSVRPSGLSNSEAIFASNLFGAIPIEQDNPVAARTASLIRRAIRAGSLR